MDSSTVRASLTSCCTSSNHEETKRAERKDIPMLHPTPSKPARLFEDFEGSILYKDLGEVPQPGPKSVAFEI